MVDLEQEFDRLLSGDLGESDPVVLKRQFKKGIRRQYPDFPRKLFEPSEGQIDLQELMTYRLSRKSYSLGFRSGVATDYDLELGSDQSPKDNEGYRAFMWGYRGWEKYPLTPPNTTVIDSVYRDARKYIGGLTVWMKKNGVQEPDPALLLYKGAIKAFKAGLHDKPAPGRPKDSEPVKVILVPSHMLGSSRGDEIPDWIRLRMAYDLGVKSRESKGSAS